MIARFAEDARRLRELDPQRFKRLVVLLRAYLSIYDGPIESLAELTARLDLDAPETTPREVN